MHESSFVGRLAALLAVVGSAAVFGGCGSSTTLVVNVLDPDGADAATEQLAANGETVLRLGEVVTTTGDAAVGFRGSLDLSW